MEDYNRVLDATTVSENANGTAAEKMTIYTQTLEAAQNNLTSSIQQFAQDSNLDQILIAAYNGLAKVVDILNILLNKIPVLSPMIKTLGAVVLTAFGTNMVTSLVKGSEKLSLVGAGFSSLVKHIGTVISALSSMQFAFGTFSVSALGVIGGVSAAVIALVAVVTSLKKAWDDAQPEAQLKRSTEALEDSQQELDSAKSDLDEINQKIKEINDKGALTLADEQEKKKLEDQRDVLQQVYDYKKKINEENEKQVKQDTATVMGEKYTVGTSDFDTAYQKALENRAKREEADRYIATAGTGPSEYYEVESASVAELTSNIKLLNEEQQKLTSSEGEHGKELEANNQKLQENINQLREKGVAIGEDITKMQDMGLTDTDAYKNAVEQWNQIQVILDPSNFETISLENLIDTSGLKQKVQKAAQDTSDAGKEAARGYAEKFAQQILDDNSMKQAWATSMGVTTEYLKNNTDVLIQELLTKFQQMYVDIEESARSGYSSTTQAFSDYLTEVDALTEKQTLLNKALGEMQYNGELTSDTVKELIKEYPQLSDKIEVHNGKLVIEKQYLEDVWTTAVEASRAKQQAQIDDTKTTIENIQSRIQAYMGEIEVLQQLAAAGDKSAGRVAELRGILDDPNVDKNSAKYINAAREFGRYMTEQNTELYKYSSALERAQEIYNNLGDIPGLTATKPKGYTSSKSGTSDAEKQFETEIKNRMKYLKGIVSQYALEDTWEDPATITKYTNSWNNMLSSVVDTPEARKIVADALGVDISKMSGEEAKTQLTKLLKEQYGDIQTKYQELLKNKAKEDLNAAKTIINAYKEGVYGAWSSDEALNAAKADYDKFIKEITDNEEYRKAVAESLNLGDISKKTAEEQIQIVVEAWKKSAGTLEEAQQDLYDDASKNIQALQDEIEDMLDTAIDLLEKAGDFLFDILDKVSDRYDTQIDNLDKISDELDDQKDAFEDKIDQQKELLKLQKEEMDNADELAEKNKSIADIDAQLMELQYDNSAEAQAKRLKLLDERAEKEKDLADWQNEYDYNTKIDALDKEKSEYEKTIEAEKKAIEAQKQALKDAQSQFETTLSKIQNGFNTFIKILSSDLVKNLISKALINSGSDTVTNLLVGYNKIFGTGIDTDVTGIIEEGYKSLGEIGGKLVDGLNLGGAGDIISNMLSGITKTFGDFSSGIGKIIQPGINVATGIFNGFGDTLKGIFNIDWNGITTNVQSGLQVVSGVFSKMFNPIANGAFDIGNAIGSGITGFFPSIFKAIGTLITTVGGAMGGLLQTIGETMASIPVVGWVIAAAAIAGAIALVATVASIASKANNAKVSQPTQSFTAKKHHTGADYVKKENPALDKMLGLNDDETVSILHVGEAVVPTWANNATSSASSNRFTGSPFGSAVDTAVKSARANTRTYSSSDNSTVSISMPINIQGDADATTVTSLKREADNIVNRVLRTINNQTRIGGYRNIKAATV